MAALRNLKAVVMGCFIISYLVIGAFFALVFLVVPPALVLRPFARRAYYSFITVCFGNYWYSTIYILEQMTGTKVRIHGELPRLEETVLVICNHKCDLDYCYLWSALARAPAYGYWRVGLFKAVLKAQIKVVPVFAWGLKMCGFLYLSRSWDTDRARMKRWASAMARDKIPMYLVIYPEGTRYTDRRKASSDAVAREKGHSIYESELLLPRTKGFVLLVRSLAGYIPTIMDMTIAYAKRDGSLLKGSELGTGVLKRAFCGESPVGTVHLHFKHFAVAELPDNDEKLVQWTMERWAEKNALLGKLAKDGSFPSEPLPAPPPSRLALFGRIFGFTALSLLGVHLLTLHVWFRLYCVGVVVMGIAIAWIDPPEW